MKMLIGLCAIALFASAASAGAQQFRLKALPGASVIFIWKSADAQSEAMSLIQAGVHKTNPALVMRLLACTAEPGTKVIITDGGFVTQDIMVIEGPSTGCRGNIPTEELAD